MQTGGSMNQEHITKQFDVDLEGLRSRVLAMGGLVEQQLIRAMEALESGDMAQIEQVIANDRVVNRHEVELDEACNHVIAKRQPAAVDLRMIMTVVKTITDLERIGDEAKKIAKMARAIHAGDIHILPRVDLRRPADIAVVMLRKSLDAFARLDVSAVSYTHLDVYKRQTLGETIGMAAEVAHGSCTDLPPMRRK